MLDYEGINIVIYEYTDCVATVGKRDRVDVELGLIVFDIRIKARAITVKECSVVWFCVKKCYFHLLLISFVLCVHLLVNDELV